MSLTSNQKKFIKGHHHRLSITKISKKVGADPDDVKSYIRILTPDLDPRRKRIFWVIILSFPIFFLIVLELVLQIFKYGGNFNLFISAPGVYSDYKICNPYVGRRYFFMQSSIPDPSNDLFLKVKPDNGYRIFVLGGSTTAGYPYGENLLFSRILEKRLSDTFPEKHVEVVNTATSAINSYTLLDFMDEILDNEPDAILIYAGHNEFYGALGVASVESLGKFRWFVRLYLKLKRYRTFILLRDTIGQLRNLIGKLFAGESLSDPSATLMERLVAEQMIPYGGPIYELGKKQFKANLSEILDKTKTAAVPIILSELISNVKDQYPFVSVKSDTFPKAEQVFIQARFLEKDGRLEEAKKEYYRAKDLDALRFRATEDFNQIIHQLASQYNTAVVPMKFYFESRSPNGLIGNKVMLEHLHPNIDGHFLMAQAFFETMQKHKFIQSDWHNQKIFPMDYYRKSWGYTELDSLYGALRIRILKGGWPFKPRSVPNRALLDYYPTSKAESLSVEIWTDKNVNLERAHFKMAQHFLKIKDYEGTFKEYRALMYLSPWNTSPYLGAADALIKLKKFDLSLPILYKSLELEETGYANKWIGTILLNNGKVTESLPFFEKAIELIRDDAQLLYNLSGAYALDGQYEKAAATLDKMYKINPNFPDADDLKRQLDHILKK